jgi:DNA sulfur modification protein DndB
VVQLKDIAISTGSACISAKVEPPHVSQFVDEIPLFQNLTELEKTTISNRSSALFTLSAIYQATQALLGVGSSDEVSFDKVAIAREFWQELGEIISE